MSTLILPIRDSQNRGVCATCVLLTHTPPKLLCAHFLIFDFFVRPSFLLFLIMTNEDSQEDSLSSSLSMAFSGTSGAVAGGSFVVAEGAGAGAQ